jgi:hypothetical protein
MISSMRTPVDRMHRRTQSRRARGAMFSARRGAALSWNRGVPPLVSWVGMGVLTVVLIVGFAAAKKDETDG